MKLTFIVLGLAILVVPACLFAKDKQQNQTPVVWGMLGHSSGCVIFAEGHKTNGRFWGVAVTTKTYGKLTVIETMHATLGQTEYIETQETMDALTQRALADHLKYVKIPEKYSPDLLEKARAMCRQDQ